MSTRTAAEQAQAGELGLVRATVDCWPEHVAEVGGKAGGLGALLRAGQRVPASFVITSSAYRHYLGSSPRHVDAELRQAIGRGYAELCAPSGHDLAVAVRSSATAEDSTEASCAGQFRTFLGAAGETEVVAQVEQCWLAAFEPHVASYGENRRVDGVTDQVAVVVQELVDARAAGVMFTQHPVSGDRSLVVIESSYGLGEAVVGGETTPDLFEVNKITRHVHRSSLGQKAEEHRLGADRRHVERRPVDPDRQGSWSIAEDEVMGLVDVAAELETKLGRGLDIEWAIGTTQSGLATGEGDRLFILQVRPITVGPVRASGHHENLDAVDRTLGRLAGGVPRNGGTNGSNGSNGGTNGGTNGGGSPKSPVAAAR